MTRGLVLTGGGARGAYQAGVLKGIAEVLGNTTRIPFPIVACSSAGAINGEYYGDGSIRNSNPLSPAIRLGANQLCIIGVRNYSEEVTSSQDLRPSFSRLFSIMLNALFLDAVDSDLERLRLNNKLCRDVCDIEDRKIKPIDTLHIHPCVDISEIAYDHANRLPPSLKRFMLLLGSLREASALISYLMFDKDYCCALTQLGYQDALQQAAPVLRFFRTRRTRQLNRATGRH